MQQVWWSSLVIPPDHFPPQRLCVEDTWTWWASARSQTSSWQKVPKLRESRTGTIILLRRSGHGAPASNDYCTPTAVITQHCLHAAAFISSQKSRFRGNGNNTNINCSHLNCSWTFRHHQSQKHSVFMAKITPFSLWERKGSAVKRDYSEIEENTQPETYFSFYNGVNWP